MKIGIIGFGRFGKLITKYLSEDFEVFVHSRSGKNKEIKRMNTIPVSLKEVCKKDIIIPCVPISAFEETLHKIKKFVNANSLVVDVCSVKEYPVNLMKNILPKKVQILATHPMFGPDSASKTLEGKKIALCKIRITDDHYKKIKSYLKKKKLIVIETTPEKHDKEIAKSLVLTHFIGRSLIELGISDLNIDTLGYKRLMKIIETVRNDTWQLFEDMNHYNRYSKKTREDFIKAMSKINKRLRK